MTRRVLVVDDERSLNALAAEYLRLAGCEVVQCYDAESALSLLREDPRFDVVVLDKRLPGLDGWQACRAIKADARLKHIPVILLSASVSTQAPAEPHGADRTMSKPFSPKDLARAIEELLA